MESKSDDRRHFHETLAYPYLYAFWRQAEADANEVAALHRIDRTLQRGTFADAAARLAGEDVWRMGPFTDVADADTIEGELRAAGFRVERRLQ